MTRPSDPTAPAWTAETRERLADIVAAYPLEPLKYGAPPRIHVCVAQVDDLRAALAYIDRLEAAQARETWRLVPVQPTEAMIDAYFDKARELGFTAHMNASCMWETMLAALPTPDRGG